MIGCLEGCIAPILLEKKKDFPVCILFIQLLFLLVFQYDRTNYLISAYVYFSEMIQLAHNVTKLIYFLKLLSMLKDSTHSEYFTFLCFQRVE